MASVFKLSKCGKWSGFSCIVPVMSGGSCRKTGRLFCSILLRWKLWSQMAGTVPCEKTFPIATSFHRLQGDFIVSQMGRLYLERGKVINHVHLDIMQH